MIASGLAAEIKPVRAGDQVYHFLQKAIMDGQIKAGEPIDTSRMTSLLKVSRMPLRDAINRLENEGWVTRQINGRVVVSKISLQELIDFYAVRSVLEGLAVKEAISHMTDADLLEIEEQLALFTTAANENVSAEALVEAGKKLHSLIHKHTKNEVCKHMLEEINANLARYRVYTAATPGRYKEALNEHMEIFNLIKERKADKAEALMRMHIVRAGEKLKLKQLNRF